MDPITISQQVACVRREISMRKRVYPRWVQAEKMTQAQADEQLACMEAVRETLEKLQADEKARVTPGLF